MFQGLPLQPYSDWMTVSVKISIRTYTYVLYVQMLSQYLGFVYVCSFSLDFIFVNNLYLLTFSMRILSLSKGEFLLCENMNI